MNNESNFERCHICKDQIDYREYVYTLHRFNISLCSPCEKIYMVERKNSTEEEIKLYIALRKAEIPATLQHYDGFKTVDIAINNINLNIEVDGSHHYWKSDQALVDLKRSVYSLRKDVDTLRIPNKLVNDRIRETVRSIKSLYDSRQSKLNLRSQYKQGSLFQ